MKFGIWVSFVGFYSLIEEPFGVHLNAYELFALEGFSFSFFFPIFFSFQLF